MSENLVEVKHLQQYFPAGGMGKNKQYVQAVDDVSFAIRKGETLGLVGESGCGKTTTGRTILRLYDDKTAGQVLFNGKRVVENHPKGKLRRQYKGKHMGEYKAVLEPTPDKLTKMGMARTFQNIRLWKSMTVFDNVLIAKHLRRSSNLFTATFRLNKREETRQREEVLELLRVVGLEDVRNELATSLPYGKQRRLEIARALATDPTLLLLDEPAAGMNPQETLELASFIREIRDHFQKTILLIEHHMDLVMGIADRIYVLDFGKLIAKGTPEEIQNNERVIDAYLGVAEDAED